MKRRLLLSLVAAGVAVGTGVASANPSYWHQNGLLLEVSADPRDGSDFVQVNPMRAQGLELTALNATVQLRGMTVRFADGRSFYANAHNVRPGQPVRIDLPHTRSVITNVQLDYIPAEQRRFDRTPARLQIRPIQDRFDRREHYYGDRYQRPSYRYQEPSYGYRQPTQRYREPTYAQPGAYYYKRPAQRSTWTIEGSFRF